MRRSLLATVVIAVFCFNYVSAQGTTQINIVGIPPVLPSPFISDIENNYHMGQYQMQMTYTSQDPNPVEFEYHVSLLKNGNEIINTSSKPVSYTPGTYYYHSFENDPAIEFSSDFLDLIDGDLYETIIRTGYLPEGSYVLSIELVPLDPFSGVISIPGFAYFEVMYPQPPFLISPMDETNTPLVYSVFSWTPVIGLPGLFFEYDLLIVEVLPGQTPQQAIESNYEHLMHITQQPLFIYTHEHLPLETGKEYAWMVTAREVDDRLPISDDGKTEVFTFTAGDIFVDIDPDELERIPIIPNFAEIVLDTDIIEITQQQYSFIINGPVTLEIHLADENGIYEIPVMCYDFEVYAANIDQPVPIGGSISGNISDFYLPLEGVHEVIMPEGINWTLSDGLHIEASIIGPDGEPFQTEGLINLGPPGLSGTITAGGHEASPLLEFGENPFELAINSISVFFPGAIRSINATLDLFGEGELCQLTSMPDAFTGSISMSLYCNINHNINLIPGNEIITLFLQNASGDILINWSEQTIQYTAILNGALQIDASAENHYSVPFIITFSSEDGVTAEVFPPGIILNAPAVNMGIAELTIRSINNAFLQYDTNTLQWDVGINPEFDLRFPAFDDLEFAGINTAWFNMDGLNFDDITYGEEQLQWLPQLDFAGFGANLRRFNMPSLSFSWDDWGNTSANQWEFELDFKLKTPDFPSYLPACLRNLSLNVNNATYANGQFSALIPSLFFDENACMVELGAGYALLISEIGGHIFGDLQAGYMNLNGYLQPDAALRFGTPFTCDSETTMYLGTEDLRLHGDGIIEGEIINALPPCPLTIGPFITTVNESLLSFYRNNNQQKASFDAIATIEIPSQDGGLKQIQGEIGIDLLTGAFYNLHFNINEPFAWMIPYEDEVLLFHINEAAIGLDGLYINGDHTLVVGNTTINAAFYDFLFDLSTFTIADGHIEFSEPFALLAGIDSHDASLNYQVLPVNSQIPADLNPGIYFELTGNIIIDDQGLHVSGSSAAQLNLGNTSLDDLTTVFSPDFTFALHPFNVANGQIDILLNEILVAIIDVEGFRPVFDFLDPVSMIPDKLPLPNLSIAYVTIKEGDELLIDFENDPDDDLAIIISTQQGRPLEFVLPVLQGNNASPPSIEVEFNNVKVSLSPFLFESGEITVHLTGDEQGFDLTQFGIPLVLEKIFYGSLAGDEFSLDGLFFAGELMLFDQALGENASIYVYVNGDGTAMCSFELTEMNTHVPLLPGSELVTLQINSITGFAEYNFINPGDPVFSFIIDGGFIIDAADGNNLQAEIIMEYNQHGLSLQHFYFDEGDQHIQLAFDPFVFQIERINSLSLSYQEDEGFDFYTHIDMSLGMQVETDTLLISLQGVEIRPDGLAIPNMEINDSSNPPIQLPVLQLSGFELQPLAFRISQIIVDIFNPDADDLINFIPRLDFALSFPGMDELSPQLAEIELMINDAVFQDGVFSGSIDTYNPLDDISLNMNAFQLNISEFSGSIYEEEAQQMIDVNVAGNIPPLPFFAYDDSCDPVGFEFSIEEGEGLSGILENFAPCGWMSLGSLSLMFMSSEIAFAYSENEQTATLGGEAMLKIPQQNANDIEAYGTLTLDLMTASVVDGHIIINEPFQWAFPEHQDPPFMSFTVESARFDSRGLMFLANGSMNVSEQVQVNVSFNDFLIDVIEHEIIDGDATISSGFGFEMQFMPIEWQMVELNQDFPEYTNVIRMNFVDTGIQLDKNGLAFAGEITADIKIAHDPDEPEQPVEHEIAFGDVRLVFLDDFRMHLPPTSKARNGRAELWLDDDGSGGSTLLAWYDTDGLGLGNILGILPIPDTLGLPTNDIAYMLLRNEQGELVVELDVEDGNRILRTKENETVEIVIPGITDESEAPLQFSTDFSITVNDVFDIVDGYIQIDLANNYYGNEPFKIPGIPLKLTGLGYEKGDDGTGALTASALLKIPGVLDDAAIIISEIKIGPSGFERAVMEIGNEDSNENISDAFPKSFANDLFAVNVYYVYASLGQETAFSIKGSFESSFFTDTEGDTSPLPFTLTYNHNDSSWDGSLDFNFDQPLNTGIAQINIIPGYEIHITEEEIALKFSCTISMPDLLGEDFGITLNDMSIGTNGIEIGEIIFEDSDDNQEPDFHFFAGKLKVWITELSPDYNNNEGVLFLSMSGALEILDINIPFDGMTIGTDGSFNIGEDIDISLLEEEHDILANILVAESLILGLSNNRFELLLEGRIMLPDPFNQSSLFTVRLTQLDKTNVAVAIDGLEFDFANDFEISDDRMQVSLGDLATLDLTAVKAELDFEHIANTTFYATAAVYIQNDPNQRIEFGEAQNITTKWGFRYNHEDEGFQWQITNHPQFSFERDFFKIALQQVRPLDGDIFGFEIDGDFNIKLSGVSGGASFTKFQVSSEGIQSWGSFGTGFNITIMDKVALRVDTLDFRPDGGPLTLQEGAEVVESDGQPAEPPDDYNPESTVQIETDFYLLIKGASLTITESFGGGVERVLIYRERNGDSFHLHIDSAHIQLGDFADAWLSMRYITAGNDYHLSAAGAVNIQGTGAAMAGKIEKKEGDISFGLFVKAEISTGIPVIPGIATLMGVGGGFFLRPDSTDFVNVRRVAGLNYLNPPEFDNQVGFAAFLYAEAGLIGTQTYAVKGKFFLEVTDQQANLFVNGQILEQDEEDLFINTHLALYYGANKQGIQGLAEINVNYDPIVTGTGRIGFFALKEGNQTVWAIYGDKQLEILSLMKTESSFIVCNGGMLFTSRLGFNPPLGRLIKINADLEASIWHSENSGFGAYGLFDGTVHVFGIGVRSHLYAAYISQESLFYAAGSVYVDVLIFSGRVGVWASHDAAGWKGGRGSNREYEDLINSSRQEAENLLASANAAAEQTQQAMDALQAAADMEALKDSIFEFLDNHSYIQGLKASMDESIGYIDDIAPGIIDQLGMDINEISELLAETTALADSLENPMAYNKGAMEFVNDTLVVHSSPGINLDEDSHGNNQEELKSFQDELQEQLEFYEEIISQALGNLAELEMVLEGRPSFSITLADIGFSLPGNLILPANLSPGFLHPTPSTPSLMYHEDFDHGRSYAFDDYSSGPMPSPSAGMHPGGGSNPGGTETSETHINYLAEKFTDAVEKVMAYHTHYANYLWAIYYTNFTVFQSDPVFMNQAIEKFGVDPNVQEAALAAIDQFIDRYNEVIVPLKEAHAAFTSSYDNLYMLVGEMTSTVYAMLEAYAYLLELADEDKVLVDIQSFGHDLAQSLEPPVISALLFYAHNPKHNLYGRFFQIGWIATHPREVVESSYSISSEGLQPFRTAGNKNTLTHGAFKREADEIERIYSIGIRARGSGGNTRHQIANINLAVDPDGKDSTTGLISPETSPPPSIPDLILSHYNYTTIQTNCGSWPKQYQCTVRQYWSNSDSEIKMRVSSHAEGSDIASFHYAIGTYKGGDNIREWTQAVGVMKLEDISLGGITRSMDISAGQLSLEHNTPYYISIKAFNAHGDSSLLQSNKRLIYDATPPSKPTPITYTTLPSGPPPNQSTSSHFSQVPSAPGFYSPKFNYPENYIPPTFNISWNHGTDPESGIAYYDLALSTHGNADDAFNEGFMPHEGQTSLNFSANDSISYTQPLHLHMRSVNWARSHSEEAMSISPVQAADPSPPTRPVVRAGIFGTKKFSTEKFIRLFFTQLSLDGESQVIGYQYSIGTKPGHWDIRAWPSGIDFDQDIICTYEESLLPIPGQGHQNWNVSTSPWRVPVLYIPETGLPQNTTLFLNVRAVNSQGLVSEVVTTGPFQLGTAPAEPVLSFSYNNTHQVLTMQINNIFDPGAAIKQIQYRIRSNSNPFGTYSPWIDVLPFSPGYYPAPQSRTVNHQGSVGSSGVTIQVVVRNSAGKSTTVTSSYIPPITPLFFLGL